MLLCLTFSHNSEAIRQLRGNGNATRRATNDYSREDRSLVNSFPFNIQEKEPLREQRQRSKNEDINFASVASVRPDRNGKKCIDKVEMVEETEYDEVIKCEHSYDKKCHTTYITSYQSQQEQECDENFRKNCFIEYEKFAFNETVSICRKPLVKDCDVQSEEVCRTEYETECWTRQDEQIVNSMQTDKMRPVILFNNAGDG